MEINKVNFLNPFSEIDNKFKIIIVISIINLSHDAVEKKI